MIVVDWIMNICVVIFIAFLAVKIFDKDDVLEWKIVNFVNNTYDWVVTKCKNLWEKLK